MDETMTAADLREAIRDAVIECRNTDRKALESPTPAAYAADDAALNKVFELIRQIR
jgi:hypothetical protein